MKNTKAEISKRKIKTKAFTKNFNNRFFKILDIATEKQHEAKDLIFTEKIRSMFELLIDKKRLKDRNVQLITLNQNSIRNYEDTSESALFFFVTPTHKNFDFVKKFMISLRKKKIKKSNRSLIVFPKRNILRQLLLRQYKLHEIFKDQIFDFNVNLIPLDIDLISLEDDNSIRDLFITKEFGCYNKISDMILKIQTIYGKAASVFTKGVDALEVLGIVNRDMKTQKLKERFSKGNFYFFYFFSEEFS